MGTKLVKVNGAYKFNVFRKNAKPLSPGTFKTPKHYQRNTINDDLHRSKRILSHFDQEIPLIKEKFVKADYILRFINSVVSEFEKGKECGDERFIISPSFFRITEPLISIEITYCELKTFLCELKIKSKTFFEEIS